MAFKLAGWEFSNYEHILISLIWLPVNSLLQGACWYLCIWWSGWDRVPTNSVLVLKYEVTLRIQLRWESRRICDIWDRADVPSGGNRFQYYTQSWLKKYFAICGFFYLAEAPLERILVFMAFYRTWADAWLVDLFCHIFSCHLKSSHFLNPCDKGFWLSLRMWVL